MKDKITDSVSFHCSSCRSDHLIHPGAVKTQANRLYIAFVCENCHQQVPIEIDRIIAELYQTPLGPESNQVN